MISNEEKLQKRCVLFFFINKSAKRSRHYCHKAAIG